jgi:hypothetical protein
MYYRFKVFGTLQSRRCASLQIVEDSSHGVTVFLRLQLLVDFRLVCRAKN